ncbi:DNA gyrase subunit A [Candidatus Mycoplasma haematohominis]|uniref:DNA topoisomerase (ATP-hydrolyzing) n=1 Tax=Candidatus Mycoplasma haematohominis TaxID=1494318 RepID=A0A478FQ85_9MOLU|nr:DNA gyrase subunit A [Candidatus Mycoplasma haemohominis]
MSRQNIKDRVLKILENDDANKIKEDALTKEMQNSFLEYAMSVIKSRALPDYRDGLKPVHRRIIYAAAQEGLTHDKKYKKSAAIVGSVMGSYHPHGDMAIYDALVRMAQGFSLRYPLIQGQGNFGSVDGDAPAAMRYTEARLSELSSQFTDGLGEDWVEMSDNYDQSKKEPVVLPTLIPNVLVNGSEGIAVGLATKIPPHNLREVIDASIALIKDPNVSDQKLFEYIQGPDFPTGGEILNYRGVEDYFYLKERGKSFRLRAKIDIEKDSKRKGRLIIREIPYGVKKSAIIKQIVSYMDSEKKRGLYIVEFDEYIKDIRDESSRDEIRVVIEYQGCNPEVILNNLYKHTRLQISYATGLVVLKNNEPQRLSVPAVLKLYVEHQFDMMKKRATYRIAVLSKRIHILDGRLIVVDDILEAVKIITQSENPDQELKNKYKLSKEQLEDILALPIGRLRKLSVSKMETERDEKTKLKKENEELLASEDKQKEKLIKQLGELRDKYGDERRTRINKLDNGFISNEDTKNYEDMMFILSKKSYLSQIPLSSNFFRAHKKRRNKTFIEAEMYKEDAPRFMLSCYGKDDLLFFTSKGKVYKKKAFEFNLKNGLKNKGKLINNLLPSLSKDEKVVHMMRLKKEDYNIEDMYLVFVTRNGKVKRTHISLFRSIMSNGKIAIRLREMKGVADQLSFVLKATDSDDICLVGSEVKTKTKDPTVVNKLVRCKLSGFRPQGRAAGGQKGIKLNVSGGQHTLAASTTYEGKLLATVDNKGYGKLHNLDGKDKKDSVRLTSRGAMGINIFKASAKENKKCIACMFVDPKDDILIMTEEDKIYTFKSTELGSKNEKGEIVCMKNKSGKGRKLLNQELENQNITISYCTKLPFDAVADLEDDGEEDWMDDADNEETTTEAAS